MVGGYIDSSYFIGNVLVSGSFTTGGILFASAPNVATTVPNFSFDSANDVFLVEDLSTPSSTTGALLATRLSQSPTASNQRLGMIGIGADDYDSARIVATSSEAWSAGAKGSHLSIELTKLGEAARTSVLDITSQGFFGFGVVEPAFPIHVVYAITSAYPACTLATNGTNGRPYLLFRKDTTVDLGFVGCGSTGADTFFVFSYQNADLVIGTNGLTYITLSAANNNVSIGKDLVLSTAGNKLKIAEGSNATMGVATLVGGTVVVSTTKTTASSRVFLTGQDSSGTHGELTVSARTAGTSFTITSTSGTDTRSVAWIIIDPA